MAFLWSIKFAGSFEHDCTSDKSLYVGEATSKHVIIQCSKCKRKYFYRATAITNDGLGLKIENR